MSLCDLIGMYFLTQRPQNLKSGKSNTDNGKKEVTLRWMFLQEGTDNALWFWREGQRELKPLLAKT